ncbi:MAG: hypothetical protein EXR00_01130 [Alphaproteobacteria bacterium]|nr:hypothetical protein [Alphaproteobacteria bacterium]
MKKRVFAGAIAAMVVVPVTATPAETIPDFSGIWWHPSLPGPEPLASGPTSLRNMTRRKADGASDYNELVGDYSNPILKPEAAQIVKKHGELSKAGVVYPNPASQCWPEPLPFIYKNFGLQILQQPHQITMLYEQDHEVRRVRMNQAHPAVVTPSWYGDSVGYYDGDTLVIDTVGQKAGPFSMLDLYGTPYTKALHVVERYRLLDYDEAKEGLDRDTKENFHAPVGIDRTYRGKHLQVRFTVEDDGVFTTPWSATVTYGRGSTDWPETVCAENVRVYYSTDTAVPTADKPDF